METKNIKGTVASLKLLMIRCTIYRHDMRAHTYTTHSHARQTHMTSRSRPMRVCTSFCSRVILCCQIHPHLLSYTDIRTEIEYKFLQIYVFTPPLYTSCIIYCLYNVYKYSVYSTVGVWVCIHPLFLLPLYIYIYMSEAVKSLVWLVHITDYQCLGSKVHNMCLE